MCVVFCLPRFPCDPKRLISYSKSTADLETVIPATMVISGVKLSSFPWAWFIFHFERVRSHCTFLICCEHLKDSVSCLVRFSVPSTLDCAQHYEHFLVQLNQLLLTPPWQRYLPSHFSLQSPGRGVTWSITEYSGMGYRGSDCNCKTLLKPPLLPSSRGFKEEGNGPLGEKMENFQSQSPLSS